MAACPLFRLWGSHFGTRLVAVEVEGPRLEFEGAPGVRPATDPPLPESEAVATWVSTSGTGEGWSWQVTGENEMELSLEGFQGESYSAFATAEVEGGRTYTLEFEARLVGSMPEDAVLGLGLVDSRGWEATESGCGADSIGRTGGWAELQCSVNTLLDADEIVALWRLVNPGGPLTAAVEVRAVRLLAAPTDPPYAALTAAASLSDDGRRLYLMVFNKHHEEPIEASIEIQGFSAAAARCWEVTGPSLEATNLQSPLVAETISGSPAAEVGVAGFDHTFPAHSMTAFEIEAETVREASGRLHP
jgi:alpha-L-arabinofuranosidase